ncbi:GrpB family protein [Spirosoma foliorum]|uniref:GrpB family protein n=1 Tax=Spirosoma foliorum TaxID=2710596 RepID=A0A7G5H4P6_9BACT|nr:GrpB family protein [Spirosoma foliorum]QMW06088.1 GrpB family protein [Spirosoma foliorum]
MPTPSVVIAPYNPDWASWALQEIDRLARPLRPNLITIEHIGSTSVPGLAAKPIIDLLPIVQSLEILDEQRSIIEGLGYLWYGEYGISERRYCKLIDAEANRVFHVHFFPSTSIGVTRHLAFRDYLRAYPAIAEAYQNEKQRAAALHPFDSSAYTEEKSTWIRQHETDALNWFVG